MSLTEQLEEAEEVAGELVILHDLLTCAAAEADVRAAVITSVNTLTHTHTVNELPSSDV